MQHLIKLQMLLNVAILVTLLLRYPVTTLLVTRPHSLRYGLTAHILYVLRDNTVGQKVLGFKYPVTITVTTLPMYTCFIQHVTCPRLTLSHDNPAIGNQARRE